MGKNDLRRAYPQLDPDRECPPLHFKSRKGNVSAAECETRVAETVGGPPEKNIVFN